jgi:septal ring-binding cell division protein DamX
MARKRNRRNPGRDDPVGRTGGWKQAVPAAVLVGAVFLILILSAVLQIERESPQPEPVPTADTDRSEREAWDESAKRLPRPRQEREPQPPADPLERRCREDYRRLSRDRSGWTLQLMIACDPENARKMLDRSGGSDDLYVLPFDHEGDPCYRICWGVYGSRESAEQGRERLPAFTAELGKSTPKSIGEVTP